MNNQQGPQGMNNQQGPQGMNNQQGPQGNNNQQGPQGNNNQQQGPQEMNNQQQVPQDLNNNEEAPEQNQEDNIQNENLIKITATSLKTNDLNETQADSTNSINFNKISSKFIIVLLMVLF